MRFVLTVMTTIKTRGAKRKRKFHSFNKTPLQQIPMFQKIIMVKRKQRQQQHQKKKKRNGN